MDTEIEVPVGNVEVFDGRSKKHLDELDDDLHLLANGGSNGHGRKNGRGRGGSSSSSNGGGQHLQV